MKLKSFFLLSALSLMLLTACKQEQAEPIDFYFCATSPSLEDDQWSLYVDGNLVGLLPNYTTLPNCSNTAALSSMIHLVLSQERHTYEAKDGSGTVRSVGYFQCVDNAHVQKLKAGGNKGGSAGAWGCDMVVMSVFD